MDKQIVDKDKMVELADKGIKDKPDIENQDKETKGKNQEQPEKGTRDKLRKAYMLVNFLPAKTLLIFDMLISLVSGKDECDRVGKSMMLILMCLCILSCLFAQLVDSYYDEKEKKLYHGFVTYKGLWGYKSAGDDPTIISDKSEYKWKGKDAMHIFMSIFVFLVFAFSDNRVSDCLMPRYKDTVAEVMKSLPLMVSIICAGLLLIVPNPRFGGGLRG